MTLYGLAKKTSQLALATFFRQVEVIGLEHVPVNGPLILYANHNNQFADALVLINHCPRKICFLAAEKSMKRPLIGHFARAFGAIPVQRAGDLSWRGQGFLQKLQNGKLMGNRTEFLKIQSGFQLKVQGLKKMLTVKEIRSDLELIVQQQDLHLVGPAQYHVTPKLSFQALYQNVWDSLSRGQCIGIFPEGGSHDRSDLLPFKAGIVIMALGAALKHGVEINIVPCGINYFHQDKFRTKVVLQFGQSFKPNSTHLALYRSNKKEAISLMLKDVQQRLRDVTMSAPSFSFLKTLFLMRSLYLPSKEQIDTKKKLDIVRKFAQSYNNLKQDPQIQSIFNQAESYKRRLQSLGLIDRAHLMPKHLLDQSFSLLLTLVRLLFSLGLSLPGLLLVSPVIFLIRRLSQRERLRCLKQSSVKIQARDIVASYKILLGAVLLPIYSIICGGLLHFFGRDYFPQHANYILILFLLLWPFYFGITVRSFDGVLSNLRKFRSKFSALFNRSQYEALMQERMRLRDRIHGLVQSRMQPLMGHKQNSLEISQSDISKLFQGIQLNSV